MELRSQLHPEIVRSRTAEDVDLVALVHEKLSTQQWNGLDTWREEPEIARAASAPPELQRMLIARNLQDRFLGQPVDTRIPRLVLNAQGPVSEFVDNIGEYVAPALAQLYPVQTVQ